MQDKVERKMEHAQNIEHFESNFNAAMRPSVRF